MSLSEIRHIEPLRETWFEERPARVVRPKAHTLSAIDRALNGLRRELVTMGRIAIDQIDWIAAALLDGKLQLSEEAQSRATHLRELDQQIDREIFRFVALYHPVARDLREVRGLLRISMDIGNLATELEIMARLAPQFGGLGRGSVISVTRQLKHLAELAATLLRHSVHALHDSQSDLQSKVIERRDEVRSEFERALRILLTFSFESDGHRQSTVDVLFMLNGLERVADRAWHIGTEILSALDQRSR